MKLTINLPATTLEQLQAEALATGKDIETVVCEAVDARLARRKQKFAEILKPFHDSVLASGMSETEFEALVEQELQDVRAERRTASARTLSPPSSIP